MGWTGIPSDQTPDKAHLDQLVTDNVQSPTYRIIERSGWLDYSRHQFLLVETDHTDQDSPPTNNRSVLMIMAKCYKGEVLLKQVHETMGPEEYDCPMRIMDQLANHPPLNDHAARWREKVLGYHAEIRPRKAVLRKLRQQHPYGDMRLVLRDGSIVTYGKGTYHGRRNVSAYLDPKTQALTILRLGSIDATATLALWSDTGQ